MTIIKTFLFFILVILFLAGGCYFCKLPTDKPHKTPTETESSLPDLKGSKELLECENNIKDIALILENYSIDNDGQYPPSLDSLSNDTISLCPACGKPYIYELYKEDCYFVLKCGGKNAHMETEEVGEGHYPVYTPRYGLLLKGVIPGINDDREENLNKDLKEPLEVLKENYLSINNKDFKKSYSCRTEEWKENNPYDDYYKNWSTNITIILEEVEVIFENQENSQMKIRLYSEDKNPLTGKIDKGYYSGKAFLINEKGEWKIGKVKVEREVD